MRSISIEPPVPIRSKSSDIDGVRVSSRTIPKEIKRTLTFSEADHVVGLATGRAGSERVDGHDAETVDGVGQQAGHLRTGRVGHRHQRVLRVPLAVFAHPAVNKLWRVSSIAKHPPCTHRHAQNRPGDLT